MEICPSCPIKFGVIEEDGTRKIFRGSAARKAMKRHGLEPSLYPVDGTVMYKSKDDGKVDYTFPRPLCVCKADFPEMRICTECVHHFAEHGRMNTDRCGARRDDSGFAIPIPAHYPFCIDVNTEGECAEYSEIKRVEEGK